MAALRPARLLIAQLASFVAFVGVAAERVEAQTCPTSGWQRLLPTQGIPARSTTAIASNPSNGTVVLFGGNGSGQIYGDTWTFSGGSWTLRNTPAPSARSGHGLVFDAHRNRVVLFGGFGNSGINTDTWEWDGNTWTQVFPLNSPPGISGFTLAYDGVNQRVMLVCGTFVESGEVNQDTWFYDGSTWTSQSLLGPTGRVAASATYDPIRQRVVLFGGRSESTFGPLDDVWEYDGFRWSDASPFPGPSPREAAGITYDAARQRVVLFGGTGNERDTWEYDGFDWIQIGTDGPLSTIDLPLAQDPVSGRAIRLEPEPFRTRVWNGSTWNPTGVAFPPALYGHALVFDTQSNRPLLFGGTTYLGQQVDGLWALVGSSWQLLNDAGPTPRERAAVAFDSTRNRLVVFGGSGEFDTFADTWTYSAGTWSQLNIPGPSPRAGVAAAYDPIRDRLVVFGGRDADYARLNETWTFDGSQWSQISTPTTPNGRDRASMVFDPSRGKVVLFGGRDANESDILRDLWEFDGSTWSLITDSTISGRYAAGMSFDTANNKLIVFGGTDAEYSVSPQTWTFNAINAWQQPAFTQFGPRTDLAMVYDPSRQRTVAYGGFDEVSTKGDTWLLAAATTLAISAQPAPSSLVACEGTGPVSLTVAASGLGSLSYQWLLDNTLIAASTNPSAATSTFTIFAPTPSDSGGYTVQVTDACGSVLSSPVTVIINAANTRQCGFCPCSADFDASGGTPDSSDIDAFFNAWLAGDENADADCSGGTPDSSDINAFFTQWLAGGC